MYFAGGPRLDRPERKGTGGPGEGDGAACIRAKSEIGFVGSRPCQFLSPPADQLNVREGAVIVVLGTNRTSS